MRILPIPLVALAFFCLLPNPSPAYQPPVVVPGEDWTCTVRAANSAERTVTTSTQARLRGHTFWNGPSDARIHGPWVDIPPLTLGPGESVTTEVDLQVPERAGGVLDVEFRARGRVSWTMISSQSLPLVEAPLSGGRRGIPFRLVAGGEAGFDPEAESNGFVLEAVRDGDAWDALRARLGIVSPDSWDLHPDGDDPQPPYGGRPAYFASSSAPDLATETLLGIRAPGHGADILPRRLCIRSITVRTDGTLVCRYSYRFRRVRGPVVGIWDPGDYVLAAIPKTDAPIMFRRVP